MDTQTESYKIYLDVLGKKQMMTPIELRKKGYEILVENLGQVDAILFLQQAGWGSGDYTKERQKILDKVTRDEFSQDLQRIRNRFKKPASK